MHISRGNFSHRGATVAEDGDRRRKAALIAVSTEQHHDAWIAMLWTVMIGKRPFMTGPRQVRATLLAAGVVAPARLREERLPAGQLFFVVVDALDATMRASASSRMRSQGWGACRIPGTKPVIPAVLNGRLRSILVRKQV